MDKPIGQQRAHHSNRPIKSINQSVDEPCRGHERYEALHSLVVDTFCIQLIVSVTPSTEPEEPPMFCPKTNYNEGNTSGYSSLFITAHKRRREKHKIKKRYSIYSYINSSCFGINRLKKKSTHHTCSIIANKAQQGTENVQKINGTTPPLPPPSPPDQKQNLANTSQRRPKT